MASASRDLKGEDHQHHCQVSKYAVVLLLVPVWHIATVVRIVDCTRHAAFIHNGEFSLKAQCLSQGLKVPVSPIIRRRYLISKSSLINHFGYLDPLGSSICAKVHRI